MLINTSHACFCYYLIFFYIQKFSFTQAVDIFNHAVISPAHAVVRVTSASDVAT